MPSSAYELVYNAYQLHTYKYEDVAYAYETKKNETAWFMSDNSLKKITGRLHTISNEFGIYPFLKV